MTKSHLRSSVPSSQTSLYRSPWWVRQSGQLQSLPISLYRFPIAGANFTNLSLQTPPYKEDWEKKDNDNVATKSEALSDVGTISPTFVRQAISRQRTVLGNIMCQ